MEGAILPLCLLVGGLVSGAIAVTPLHFNWTHEAASERVVQWGLSGEE